MNAFSKFFAVLLMGLALLLTACSVGSSPEDNPEATDVVVTTAPAPSKANSMIREFGKVMSWDDGVYISVSTPAEFTASSTAMGVTQGQKSVIFTIILTNKTDAPFEPFVTSQVTSGGMAASPIFDVDQNIVTPPSAVILPGKSIKWEAAYSVADPASITFQVSPGFQYKDAIFTNSK